MLWFLLHELRNPAKIPTTQRGIKMFHQFFEANIKYAITPTNKPINAVSTILPYSFDDQSYSTVKESLITVNKLVLFK